MVLWRCQHRLISLLIGDTVTSLLLLWSLFYEQYLDKILLEIKALLKENNGIEGKKSMTIIPSCQSFVFIMLMILASLPFIATLLSFNHKGINKRKYLIK